MLFGNAVKLTQMPFCLTPKVLNSVNMIVLLGKMCAVVNTEMIELTHVQHAIALMAIRVNNAVRLNLFSDNGQ
ncbi:Uncharacterised protein [Kingella potus]|uniref:Uncharacterized protein n=1 Tax=Kingella potus TaxID=265175 RepID=A0A377R257_9NEIS|nr:Uncharacterised protein [Kingella potus]